MAIAMNPHTYSGMLFDSPWLKSWSQLSMFWSLVPFIADRLRNMSVVLNRWRCNDEVVFLPVVGMVC
eukprot:scaffold17773_cov52-Attheya_sp.AAC.1